MVHVGVDFHKRYAHVAVIEESGELKKFTVPIEAERVEEVFGALDRPAYVTVEATASWYWFVDLLQRMGHEVVLSNPKQTKAIAHARLKNDRVDACMLATLLKGELLPTVWISSPALRDQKELLGHRWITTTQRYCRVSNPQVKRAYFRAVRNIETRDPPSWLDPTPSWQPLTVGVHSLRGHPVT